MTLVVGATGMLGGEICRLLSERKRAVRALVRTTSSPEKVARLEDLGVEIAYGDLKDRSSLDAACSGVSAVVTTASSTHSRQEGDSIESVDRQGQLDLIDAAERAGVSRFVLISFPASEPDYPLQAAKRAVEDRLKQGQLTYTILHPTFFMEVWLSPALGFDAANGTARIYGSGENKISWISFQDVARFAVAMLDHPAAGNATIELGGPDALSPLEVVRMAEQTRGKAMAVQHVSEEALRAQHSQTADSMSQTFAGLMLYYAKGDVIDMAETLRVFPVGTLRSVRQHLQI
jgi:NADH dehydrogenase